MEIEKKMKKKWNGTSIFNNETIFSIVHIYMLQRAVWLNTMLNFINFVNNGLEVKDHHVSLSVWVRAIIWHSFYEWIVVHCVSDSFEFRFIQFPWTNIMSFWMWREKNKKNKKKIHPNQPCCRVCRYLVMRWECIFFGCDAILSMWSAIHIFVYVWMLALSTYMYFILLQNDLRHTHKHARTLRVSKI